MALLRITSYFKICSLKFNRITIYRINQILNIRCGISNCIFFTVNRLCFCCHYCKSFRIRIRIWNIYFYCICSIIINCICAITTVYKSILHAGFNIKSIFSWITITTPIISINIKNIISAPTICIKIWTKWDWIIDIYNIISVFAIKTCRSIYVESVIAVTSIK